MKAHEIIDRLALLDEQAPVEEPPVEPGIAPEEPATEPGDPGRRQSPDPYELPPDFEPGGLPHPKAEAHDSEAIRGWLEATQQPIQDWEWDGHDLRLLMDDGTTEIYNRGQLDQLGIFDGEMAFAESQDDASPDEASAYPDIEGPDPDSVQSAIAAEEPDPNEAAGVLDQILGRVPCGSAPVGEIASEPEVIHIEGEAAEKLTQAVSDVVQAILGVVQGETGEASDSASNKASDTDKTEDKPKGEKASKSKSDKDKGEDKDEDKKDAKKGDKKDDKKE